MGSTCMPKEHPIKNFQGKRKGEYMENKKDLNKKNKKFESKIKKN